MKIALQKQRPFLCNVTANEKIVEFWRKKIETKENLMYCRY